MRPDQSEFTVKINKIITKAEYSYFCKHIGGNISVFVQKRNSVNNFGTSSCRIIGANCNYAMDAILINSMR